MNQNRPCSAGHEKVVLDAFARDIGGRRVPGDCFCLACQEPIAAWWNNGRPEPIEKMQNGE